MPMKPLFLISFALILSLSSCIYRMDIDQGNAVEQTKVSQLELGMTKKQVKFLLGKPAVQDLYHADKWHYLTTLKSNNGKDFSSKTLVLTFENDILTHMKGAL